MNQREYCESKGLSYEEVVLPSGVVCAFIEISDEQYDWLQDNYTSPWHKAMTAAFMRPSEATDDPA